MHHANNTEHTRHDVTLIAGHAAGDLIDSERTIAETLLATCTPCADLHRDLLAIVTATRTLPAPATANRDFRLAPEQAERLRRGSWLRAALRPFASAHSAARPMAAAFTSLGIAGLLVATVIPALLGSAASPSSERDTLTGAAGAAGAAASAAPAAAPVIGQSGGPGAAAASDAPGAAAVPTTNNEFNAYNPTSPRPDAASARAKDAGASSGTEGTGGAARVEGGGSTDQSTAVPAAQAAPQNLLLIGSFGLLAAGLVLFALRFAGRRLR
jgi:hypothetical protein